MKKHLINNSFLLALSGQGCSLMAEHMLGMYKVPRSIPGGVVLRWKVRREPGQDYQSWVHTTDLEELMVRFSIRQLPKFISRGLPFKCLACRSSLVPSLACPHRRWKRVWKTIDEILKSHCKTALILMERWSDSIWQLLEFSLPWGERNNHNRKKRI